jgi:hypothetical protein
MWLTVQLLAIWSEKALVPLFDLALRCTVGTTVYASLAWLYCRKEIDTMYRFFRFSKVSTAG